MFEGASCQRKLITMAFKFRKIEKIRKYKNKNKIMKKKILKVELLLSFFNSL